MNNFHYKSSTDYPTKITTKTTQPLKLEAMNGVSTIRPMKWTANKREPAHSPQLW